MSQQRSGSLPVFQVVGDAYRFLRSNAARLAPAAVLAALVVAAAETWALGGSGAAGQADLGRMALQAVIGGLASTAFAACVLRLYIRDEFSSPLGLQLGPDEFRLVGVAVAMMLVFLPPMALAAIVTGAVILGRMQLTQEEMERLANDPEAMSEAIAAALGPGGQLAFTLFVALLIVIAFYVGSRLFVVNAATIGERKMVVFQTWSWSRGEVMRMISAIVLTLFPPLLVANILASIVIGLAGSAPTAIAYFLTVAVSTFIGLFASIPSLALGGILYRGLRPPDFSPK